MQSMSSPPTDQDEKPPLKVDADFDKALAYARLVTGSCGRACHPNADIVTVLVNSGGASDHVLGGDLNKVFAIVVDTV